MKIKQAARLWLDYHRSNSQKKIRLRHTKRSFPGSARISAKEAWIASLQMKSWNF